MDCNLYHHFRRWRCFWNGNCNILSIGVHGLHKFRAIAIVDIIGVLYGASILKQLTLLLTFSTFGNYSQPPPILLSDMKSISSVPRLGVTLLNIRAHLQKPWTRNGMTCTDVSTETHHCHFLQTNLHCMWL